MRDPVFMLQQFARSVEDWMGISSFSGDEVERCHVHFRREGPDMEIVDSRNPFQLFEPTPHGVDIEVFWRGLKEDAQ
jgi:hypothetical protein